MVEALVAVTHYMSPCYSSSRDGRGFLETRRAAARDRRRYGARPAGGPAYVLAFSTPVSPGVAMERARRTRARHNRLVAAASEQSKRVASAAAVGPSHATWRKSC